MKKTVEKKVSISPEFDDLFREELDKLRKAIDQSHIKLWRALYIWATVEWMKGPIEKNTKEEFAKQIEKNTTGTYLALFTGLETEIKLHFEIRKKAKDLATNPFEFHEQYTKKTT
jgi:hypothetical protein